VLGANETTISSIVLVANGLGEAESDPESPLDLQYPASAVRVSGDIDAFFLAGDTEGFEIDDVTYTFTRTFDSLLLDSCADETECSIGMILTVDVEPGNISMYAAENTIDVPPIDLATIDLADDASWYVVSPPGESSTEEPILMGDFTGSNAGFIVTAGSNPLLGGEQSSNTIPAEDVWITAAECDLLEPELDLNESYGVATPAEQEPAAEDADDNEVAGAEFEICVVAPDADGRAGGIYFLTFEVSIAGRPVTAVDTYSGLLTLTLTAN
jgi:hypothetical protein